MSQKQHQQQEEKLAEKRLRRHLGTLGYNQEATNYIIEKIKMGISTCEQPEKAFQIIAHKIIELVELLFGEYSFTLFLLKIDPEYVSEDDLYADLGINKYDLETMPEQKSCYLIERDRVEKKIQAEQRANLDRLKENGTYFNLRDNPCKNLKSFEFKKKSKKQYLPCLQNDFTTH